MTSVSAFNDMMGQFLTEMSKAFSTEKGIKKALIQFDMLKTANPRKVVEAYMTGISEHAAKISARDETVFDDLSRVEFLKDLNVKTHWSSASSKTQDAIWQYLQTLYMLGVTITAIDPSTLSQIENLATEAASKMESDGGGINQEALTSMLGGMLGMMNKE